MGFFTRHRGGILVLCCFAALLCVLGLCAVFLLNSPLADRIRSEVRQAGSILQETEATTPPVVSTESTSVTTAPLPTQSVQMESTVSTVSATTAPAVSVAPSFPVVYASAQTSQNGNQARIANLRLICQALDGIVLQPGQILSFNEAVGERTAQNGYQAAPGYSGNGSPALMGGGTNQGASTLYYCALLADLEILERTNGEYLSSFLEPGMDAAVGWPGPDLKLRNNTGSPIQLVAEADEQRVSMEFRSSEPRDYYLKMEYQMSSISPETVYKTRKSGSDGAVLSSGHEGYYVRTFRCKYKAGSGELISREEEVLSCYPMEPRVVVRIAD